MTTSNDIDIFKILEENGFNIKEIVTKLLEERNMVNQLLEKLKKKDDTIEELEEELEEELGGEDAENQ